ncbi:hypothetical protein IC006_2149 [Sulfuracidifex tepidarius]|uniref:Uncharacterized protein n=1 Tax=Sulfuracidifex tepidarius TaxID=1294262 RepID=A0A510DX83_9CREN|nr:hypothetical protein IC006_2149 [Sulfuracidifex tepidarius]BBG27599.1 hypothetical protein IC007_2153 [Sulfuracidifex tepidarius]
MTKYNFSESVSYFSYNDDRDSRTVMKMDLKNSKRCTKYRHAKEDLTL